MLYNELPVFKASYDLVIELFSFSKKLLRDFKYTIVQDLKRESLDLLTCIYKASKNYNKRIILLEAQEKLFLIRLKIRILKDLKQINLKKFISLNLRVENISKQLVGWEKKSR